MAYVIENHLFDLHDMAYALMSKGDRVRLYDALNVSPALTKPFVDVARKKSNSTVGE